MHNAYYYKKNIIDTINQTLECRYLIYRKNLCIWVKSDGLIAVLLDLSENDDRGSIEIFFDGSFHDELKDGVLIYNNDMNDFSFEENKIKDFLKKYKNF